MDYLNAKYIFRIDDITPGMNWENFSRIEKIFDMVNIKPIIGVVPDNQDIKLNWFGSIDDFWWKIKELHEKWWIIAQHGYQHIYTNDNPGLLDINKYSEFAGLPYDKQYEKILAGKLIMEKELGFVSKWWMAPAHSFDEVTCKVLKELGFEYITDGVGIFPFEKFWLKWLPQQIWKPKKQIFWIWTVCLHLNSYSIDFLNLIDDFCKKIAINNQIDPELISYKSTFSKTILNFIYKQYFHFLKKIYIYLKK